jgi:hypothetical protein
MVRVSARVRVRVRVKVSEHRTPLMVMVAQVRANVSGSFVCHVNVCMRFVALQCFNIIFGGIGKRQRTPERYAIGHKHTQVGFKQAGEDSKASTRVQF